MQLLNLKNVLVAVYTVLTLNVTLTYFIYLPLPYFFYILKNTLLVLSIIAIAFSSGKRLLGIFRLKASNPFEYFTLPIFTGFILIAVFVTCLGFLHLFYRPLFTALFSLALLISLIDLLRNREKIKAKALEIKIELQSPGIAEFFCLFFILLSIFLVYLSAFSPATYYDSLVYHLSIPDLYIRSHGIRFIEYNMFSHFPQYGEMLFSLGLILSGDTLCHLINFSLYALFSVYCYGFLRSGFGRKTAVTAVFLLASMPSVMLLSASAYIDTMTMAYCGLAVGSLWNYLKEKGEGFLIASALFAGFLMGLKYTGLICATILCLCILINARLKKTSLKPLGLFMLIAALPVTPWLIKNYFNTSNPLFPFFSNIFSSENGPWSKSVVEGYFRTLSHYQSEISVFQDIVLFPWDAITKVEKYSGGFDILGGFGWIPFFLLVPLGLYNFRKNKMKIFFGGYLVIYTLSWFNSLQVLRYFVSSLFILTVIAAFALNSLEKKTRLVWVWVLISLFTLSNFHIYFFLQDTFENWNVLLGKQTREEFLKKRLAYYAAFEYANKKLPDNSNILIFGEQRGFYLERSYLATWAFVPYGELAFDANPYVKWLKESADSADYAARLKSYGLTHVIYVPQEAKRLNDEYKLYSLPAEKLKILEDFFKTKTQTLYQDPNATVYGIK